MRSYEAFSTQMTVTLVTTKYCLPASFCIWLVMFMKYATFRSLGIHPDIFMCPKVINYMGIEIAFQMSNFFS